MQEVVDVPSLGALHIMEEFGLGRMSCPIASEVEAKLDVFFYIYTIYIVLLRYNSEITQFTYLGHTIKWFLVYLQICATIIIVNFRPFSSTKKDTLYVLALTLPLPTPGNN